MRPRGERSEQGAIAVVTAIVAVMAIAFSAFAVDLGNAFARQRELQTQADLAALAGAVALPDLDEARVIALDYLERNEVLGGPGTLVASDFSDGDITNGEIRYFGGNPNQLEVIAPPADVNFGLARVIGFDGSTQQAPAVAGIFTPGRLAPFFIAEGCVVPGGSRLEIKTDPGNVTPTPIDPNFYESPASPSSGWPTLTGAPTPFELYALADTSAVTAGVDPFNQTVAFPGDNLVGVTDVAFVWGEGEDERITFSEAFAEPPPEEPPAEEPPAEEPPAEEPPAVEPILTVTAGDKKTPDIVEVTVPQAALDLVLAPFDQERIVFLQVKRAGEELWSAPNAEASFAVPLPGATLPDECGEKSTGDFGLIDSPRDGSKNKVATQWNVAEGLDHPVFVYPGGSTSLETQGIPAGQSDGSKWNDVCVKYSASPPLVLDEPGADEPNCLEMYTGLKPEILDAGLIEGGGSFDGRLVAPSSVCARTRDVTLKTSWTINDDLLSCYIKDNKTVNDVLNGAVDVIDSRVLTSPRFLLVPVVHADYPPANGSYPIVDFKGAMISAEQPTSRQSLPKPEPDNGLIISKKSVGAMTVTYFDLAALPEIVATTGDVIEYVGVGPKEVRLIR